VALRKHRLRQSILSALRGFVGNIVIWHDLAILRQLVILYGSSMDRAYQRHG